MGKTQSNSWEQAKRIQSQNIQENNKHYCSQNVKTDLGFLNIQNMKLEKYDEHSRDEKWKLSHSLEYLLLCSAEEVWCQGK